MPTIARLFGKSPFAALQTHLDKVASCLSELPHLFKALLEQNAGLVSQITAKIAHLELEADLSKNDIRDHLPNSILLPLDTSALLDILSLQDSLADQSEAISRKAEVRSVRIPEDLQGAFASLCQRNMEVFWLTREVIQELEELLESSFGGIEAEKVKKMVEQIAFLEYEANLDQHRLLKSLYAKEDEMSYGSFHLILNLIEEIGEISKICEKLGNRIRMLLDLC